MSDSQEKSKVNWLWPSDPIDGSLTDVVDGISLLRLPLPIRLNHINAYLIEDDDGLVVVDTGFNSAKLRELWHSVLDGRDLGPNPKIICTHYHPDHFGLVGYLVKTFGFHLLMAQTERIIAGFLSTAADEPYSDNVDEFYRRHGMSADNRAQHRQRGNTFSQSIHSMPADYTRLRDGDQLQFGGRSFEVITASGHTPEQVCLHCQEHQLLLSADHILPRITPNTSVFPYNAGANPLGEFLEDFNKFAHIDDHCLALPGHDRPFRGVKSRIGELVAHHEARLDEVLSWCQEGPRTACELAPLMFHRDLDLHQQMFAVGEIIAHLVLLEHRGELQRHTTDGVWSFSAT